MRLTTNPPIARGKRLPVPARKRREEGAGTDCMTRGGATLAKKMGRRQWGGREAGKVRRREEKRERERRRRSGEIGRAHV